MIYMIIYHIIGLLGKKNRLHHGWGKNKLYQRVGLGNFKKQ